MHIFLKPLKDRSFKSEAILTILFFQPPEILFEKYMQAFTCIRTRHQISVTFI